MVTTAGVSVEEALSYIGMNFKRAVFRLECDGEEEWINSMEKGWRTHSVDQWLEWHTSPYLEDEVPNIDWTIALFPRNKKRRL